MNKNTASIIRHILTALGSMAVMLGLSKFTGIITYMLDNMDSLIASATSIIGFCVTLYGFFKNGDRLK